MSKTIPTTTTIEAVTLVTMDKGNPDWHGLRWVMLALVTHSYISDVFRTIHVGPDGWTATDSHRLHRYTPEEPTIPDGCYEPLPLRLMSKVILARRDDVKYPKYQDIIPDPEKARETCHAEGPTAYEHMITDVYARILRLPDGPQINYRYLRDALAGRVDQAYLFPPAIETEPSFAPVMLNGKNYTAVLMPMRV